MTGTARLGKLAASRRRAGRSAAASSCRSIARGWQGLFVFFVLYIVASMAFMSLLERTSTNSAGNDDNLRRVGIADRGGTATSDSESADHDGGGFTKMTAYDDTGDDGADEDVEADAVSDTLCMTLSCFDLRRAIPLLVRRQLIFLIKSSRASASASAFYSYQKRGPT